VIYSLIEYAKNCYKFEHLKFRCSAETYFRCDW